MNRGTCLFMMLIVAVLTTVPVSAQDSEDAAKVAPRAVPLEVKVYEIKYQDAAAINGLLTGVADGSVSTQFNTITIRASSAVHAMIEAIIEKYDIPRRTIEFQFFLVKASNASATPTPPATAGLPAKVATALNEVAGLTRYKKFELIDAPFLRTQVGHDVEVLGQSMDDYLQSYTLSVQGTGISGEGDTQIRIAKFAADFRVKQPSGPTSSFRSVGINTSFEFPEDEIIVVGTSQVQSQSGDASDTSIIVIVTATIL